MATQKKGINGLSKEPNQPQSGSRIMQSATTPRDILKDASNKPNPYLKKGGKVMTKKMYGGMKKGGTKKGK